MSKKNALAVVIGRFQPFHIGHQAMVSHALDNYAHVLVLVGATGCAPNYRNPWRADEVKCMIAGSFSEPYLARQLLLDVVYDNPYDDAAWVKAVESAVSRHSDGAPIVLVGHRKDASSFYLDLFPEWQLDEFDSGITMDATDIRRRVFLTSEAYSYTVASVGAATHAVMTDMSHERHIGLCAEAHAVNMHAKQWACAGSAKYELQHNAVDVLATDGVGRVLLIRRGGEVGRGQLAMPGGFVNKGERLLAAAIREFREEVGIALMPSQCAGQPMSCFDHPSRSMRGRIFTHVLRVQLARAQAQEAQAGDDAAEIVWLSPAELGLRKAEFFSDHFFIIKALLGGAATQLEAA